MKAKKQQTGSITQLEKILTLAGVTLILFGCIANLYSAYSNQRFIHQSKDLIYYFRYIILLGGGFTIGYLLSSKTARLARYGQLFVGVCYAVLATALYFLLDVARLGLNVYGVSPTSLRGNTIFLGLPALAVATTLIVAYVSQRKSNRNGIGIFAKAAMAISFVAYQIYMLASGAYYLLVSTAKLDPNVPLWIVIGGYFFTPLAISIVSYLLLKNIKSRFDRSFYAAFIGALYSILTLVLWEFRTDPSYAATNNFSSVVTAITLIFAAVLLWRAHKAVNFIAQ